MSKKVIAIAFSDLHINDWSKFNHDNERTKDHFKVLSLIKDECQRNDCPAIFCGDLFHKPENISLSLLNTVSQYFGKLEKEYKKKPFHIYGISGNHDFDAIVRFKNNQANKPVSWLSIMASQYSFLHCIDLDSYSDKGISFYGVPYIDHNIGLNDYLKSLTLNKGKNILLLHTDYPGAKDTDGSEVGTSENLNLNLLDRFDLTLIGHIHKPQRLSKKAFMIGAPLQQRRTDKDCELGYWKIYDDLKMQFVDISSKFPKFIDVESEEDIKDDGNYYTVISHKVEASLEKINKLNKKLSKKRLVRRYLKEKGINDIKKESILLNIIKESEND